MSKASRASGTRDFLPEQMRQRLKVIGEIKSVFTSYGYEPVETPAIEKWEVLKGKLGDEGEQLLFKILRRGTAVEDLRLGRAEEVSFKHFDEVVDFALRYDLTVPFSRLLAMNSQLPKPFKRYQIQPVWRADRPQKGRYREFYQCDVDVAGSDSILADAEIVAIVHDVMKRLGFQEFRVRLNHRKLLNGLVAAAGGEAHFQTLCIAIDKIDKIGEDGVKAELTKRGVDAAIGDQLLEWMSMEGAPEDLLAQLEPIVGEHPEGRQGLDDLQALYQALAQMGVENQHIPLDLYLVRGLDYYTGPIFEATVDEPKIGSLCGGGRYDQLIGKFSGQELPAVGATIGLERIIDVMTALGMLDDLRPNTQVLVTIFDEARMPHSLGFAQQLRQAGISTELYLKGPGKLKRQIKYASTHEIPVLAIIGEDEAKEGKVTLRTGRHDQRTVALADAAETVRDMLDKLD